MRKLRGLGLITAILFTLSCVCASCALAEADGNDNRSPANDIVIVLDQSASMNSENGSKADPEGYRMDAAQMIVGMCDMENSRVAIVPFAGTIMRSADMEFIPINDSAARTDKMKQIERLRTSSLGDNTDLGNALNLAVKLLLEREDKTNNPMIIALTDGKNDIGRVTQVVNGESRAVYPSCDRVYVWNESDNTYQTMKVSRYGVDNENENYNNGVRINTTTQQQNAVAAAKYNGIPIYSVALKDNNRTVDTKYIDELRNISDQTGGTFREIGTDVAVTLPSIFGEMFASQIGSSLLEALTPELVSGTTNRYTVNLPILNQSVQEANVYIPLTNVDANTIRLYDAGGTDRTRGATDVVYLESKNFVLYKICKPRTLGNWVLEFELVGDTSTVSDISLNLLYNYNVTFKTSVGTGIGAMNQPGEALTLGKSDHLYVISSFYEKDATTGTDALSRDAQLYAVRDGADWETIRATYELLDENGNVCASGEMVSDKTKQFEVDIDLSQAYLSDKNHNQLRGGNYSLHVTADGAGLHRENTLQLELTNQAPIQTNPLQQRIIVNDPSKPETMSVQQDAYISLNGFVADPDGDRIVCQFTPLNGADSILKVRAIELDDGSVGAAYESVIDTDGKLRYGTAEYQLTVTDTPDGASVTFPFTFEVVSVADSTLSEFDCVTTITGVDANGQAKKNSDIVFEMSLKNSAGTADASGSIASFTGRIYINDAVTAGRVAEVEMQLDASAAKLVGTYHTGNESAKLQALCTYNYGSFAAPDKDAQFDIEVPNNAPAIVTDEVEALRTTITCDPLPAFLSFLETPTAQQDRTLDLNKLFTDRDNEQQLIFTDPAIVDGYGNTINQLEYERTGDSVELIPNAPCGARVTVIATDGDGVSTDLTLNIRVVSLKQKWLLILAALIVLVVIITLVYLACRPRFFRGMRLRVGANSTIKEYCNIDSICGQKSVLLGSYIADQSVLTASELTTEDLSLVSIKPMRGKKKGVWLSRVNNKNIVSSLSARLDDIEIGLKPVAWYLDVELTLRSAADAPKYMQVTLETSQDAFTSDASNPFDGPAANTFTQKPAQSQDMGSPLDW